MTIQFPTALDSFTNPGPADTQDSVTVPHASQHADANDAIEALQVKVGINNSLVTTSLDYKVAQLETGKAATVHNHDASYSPLGHNHNASYDALGAASSAVSSHEALGDPHPQYLTAAEGAAAYDASGAAAAAISAHELAADPHTQYSKADGTRGQVLGTFSYSGDLEVNVGEARWYPPRALTLVGVQAWVSTAPVGAAVAFSINKNGVELLTGTITSGNVTMTPQTGLAHALLTTDYLTIDIDGVGSTTAGKNLTVRLLLT